MLTPAVTTSLPLDAAAPAIALPPPDDERTGALARMVDGLQGSLDNLTAPLSALADPARRRNLSTAEMIWLQAATGEYTVTLLTLSHVSQSVGSAVQSLTQRT